MVVETPSARTVVGFSTSVTLAAGPTLWVKTWWVWTPATAAKMVVVPSVVLALVNETLHTPLELVVHDWLAGETASPLVVKETDSFGNALVPSVTVACADVAELPSAAIVDGVRTSIMTGGF